MGRPSGGLLANTRQIRMRLLMQVWDDGAAEPQPRYENCKVVRTVVLQGRRSVEGKVDDTGATNIYWGTIGHYKFRDLIGRVFLLYLRNLYTQCLTTTHK